jgi:prepilin-type N-terminal cleavage/methylation domain-containing protein
MAGREHTEFITLNKIDMIKSCNNQIIKKKAFTLVEVLTALTIAALILIALFTVYDRMNTAAASINNKLDKNALGQEILQRIAEDIDRFSLSKTNAAIKVENKFDKGYRIARLTMENRLYADNKQRRRTFEKIVWQSSYDPEIDSFVLYRAHSGINYEDKLLDAQKTGAERELFVPLCSGVTYFKIEALQGRKILDKWIKGSEQLPLAIIITISFAEPIKSPTGGLDVPEESKTTRTIAVERTRKITFIVPEIPEGNSVNEP